MEWVQYIHRNFYTTSFYIDTISNPINILLDICSILKVHNIIWSLRIWIVALFGMCCVLGELSVDFFVCCRWACRLGVLGVPTRWVLGVRCIEDGIYVWYFYPSFRYCTCISVPPLLPFWLVYSIWKKPRYNFKPKYMHDVHGISSPLKKPQIVIMVRLSLA